MIARTLLGGLLLWAGAAHANIFDIYGFGARGISMGGAMTAIANDYTAAFYNPAALTEPELVRYGIDVLVTVPHFETRLSRPACLDSAGDCALRFPEGYSAREPSEPDLFAGVTVGWAIPFEVGLGRLAMGVALYVPTVNLVRAQALDPVTPQYYMYQNLPDQLVILASLAWAPVDWFSFGAGVQILADVHGEANFRIDTTNHRFDQSDIHVEIVPKTAVIAGVLFRPSKGMRIGVSYRQALSLEFGLPAEVDASGVLVIGLGTGGSVLYSPHQFQFGLGYHIAAADLTLSAELDYALWSKAPDPSPQVTVSVGGNVLDALGATGALDVGADAAPLDLGFSDTVTSRFGAEWEPLDWFTARVGYSFRPSPAPRATGPYNYLDNDVHSVAFGLGFSFMDPLSVHERPIRIDLGNAFGILPRRTILKPAGDPVGSLEHSGWTYSVSVSITHNY